MKCQKISYKTKVEAQTNLNLLLKNGTWRKKSNYGRIYRCPECKTWHVTSKMNIGSFGTEFRNIGLFYKDKWKKLLSEDE